MREAVADGVIKTIVYFVDNSIHQIPSFIYILKETGGTILTDGGDTKTVIEQEYPGTDLELCRDRPAAVERMRALAPEIIVHSDFTAKSFAGIPAKHIQVFHGTSDKPYNVDRRLEQYALVLLPGRKLRDDLAARGLLQRLRVEIVGYSKLDRVFNGQLSREVELGRLRLDPSKPSVLYAPTWRDSYGNSSIARFCREIIAGVPDSVNLIIKLHPNTKKYDHKYYPLIASLASNRPNVRLIDYAPDIIPVMAASDLLVGDVSSVTHEYLAFNRPMVFLDSIYRLGGRRATWVWRAGKVVREKGVAWQAIMESLAHPEKNRSVREELFRYIFHEPDGNAAKRAAKAIWSCL